MGKSKDKRRYEDGEEEVIEKFKHRREDRKEKRQDEIPDQYIRYDVRDD
jgi:hypothetical protein